MAEGVRLTAQDRLEKRAAQHRAEAAEKARQEAAALRAEETRARQQRQRDEAAWKTALAEAERAEHEADQTAALEGYLDDPAHTLHRDEAEDRVAELRAAIETKRRIEEKKRRETERLAEEKRQREEAAAAKAEADRQKREAEARAQNLPEMILVNGGTFQMGEEGLATPVHKVTVGDFYLGKYPVTFDEYDRFCAETKREKPATRAGDEAGDRSSR